MARYLKHLAAGAAMTGLAAYIAFASPGVAQPALAQGAAPQADAKQVYLDKCSVCHGEDGKAATAKGKKLKMKDIRSPEVQKLTPAQWTNIILKGSGEDMDAFEKTLGADMAKKLADYMRELSKK